MAVLAATKKASVLVIDDSDLCREITASCLRDQGFFACEAASAQEAFRHLANERVDLIVLDNEMPGMSGLAFLKRLRANPGGANTPVIMLTSSTSKDVVVEAMKSGVRGYLLKSERVMPEILKRVRSILLENAEGASGAPPAGPAEFQQPSQEKTTQPIGSPAAVRASPPPTRTPQIPRPRPKPDARDYARAQPSAMAPKLVTREQLLSAVAQMTQSKTLAGVVAQVVDLVGSPHSNLGELAAILKRDPVLSYRVVQMAGSSAYAGSKSRLANIEDAVRVVGAAATRDLALTVGIFDTFPPDRADGLDLVRCWRHAFAVAAAMERIVPRSETNPAGTPHLVGLCHDLHEIMLRQRFPEEYASVVDFAQRSRRSASREFASVFGLPLGELVQALMDVMKLPTAICQPIVKFAKNAGAPVEDHNDLFGRALAIANGFAHALQFASSSDEPISPVLLADCRSAMMPTAQLEWTALRNDAINATSTLCKLSPDDLANLAKAHAPRHSTRIGYMRHPAYAEMDPIEVALHSVCFAELLSRDARAENLQALDGLVVLSPANDVSLRIEACRVRSMAGRDIPILHITPSTSTSAPTEAGNVEEVSYPLTLTRLAQFAEPRK